MSARTCMYVCMYVGGVSMSPKADNYFVIHVPSEYDYLMISERKTEVMCVCMYVFVSECVCVCEQCPALMFVRSCNPNYSQTNAHAHTLTTVPNGSVRPVPTDSGAGTPSHLLKLIHVPPQIQEAVFHSLC